MSEERISREAPLEELVFMPPRPGVCPVCACAHPAHMPHNPLSIYYRIMFRQEHGRMPDWDDATAHCTDEVVRQLSHELAQRGIVMRFGVTHGDTPE